MRLREFDRKLLTESPAKAEDLGQFVRKHIFHGIPVVFAGNEDGYYDFRTRIAEKYAVGFHEVFIVGSAKLGFSFIDGRDSFTYENDVDVAIVSNELYETFRKQIRKFRYSDRYEQLTEHQKKDVHFFNGWVISGWIRPDVVPFIFDEFVEWEEFFSSISNGKSEVGNYDVHAGIYKSYEDLEMYQIQGVYNRYMRLKIKKEGES